jgi:ubiquitin
MIIPPPPARTDKRPIAFYDTECFPNYWLLKLRPQQGEVHSFRLRSGQAFGDEDIARIRRLFDAYCVVSFNGNYYDVPMICAALSGYTAEQLKWLNDRIIVEKAKPWDLGLPDWKPSDHIDVMEVAPGAGSQKQYAGRIHYKTMRDLPYDPSHYLNDAEIIEVDTYCENDLGQLEALFNDLAPQIKQREELGLRYGIDLRSKSDAQVAEAVLKKRCEHATGMRIYKPQIDWNLKFRYKVPQFITYQTSQLQRALELVKESIFRLGPKGSVEMPPQLEGLLITIGNSTYKIGIGGLHSQEKGLVAISNDTHQIRMPDVASYYPNLMVNAGAWPPALGQAFISEYEAIKNERLAAKLLQAKLKKAGDTKSKEYEAALVGNEGGKIMINGTFGKTGSPYSVLFAPEMLIQTTITGQLSLLMLIEWHEHYGIPVISANTDGIVINCPREKLITSEYLIAEWEKRTGLEMETEDYVAIYARDVNNYFAIKTPTDIKRKGEYAKAGLVEKKNPSVEICADAVAEFLANGTPIIYTIAACRDIRKFVTIQKVNGGGIKMWGEGPRKGYRVMDMLDTLVANGWVKEGRKWRKGVNLADATTAYQSCFSPQTPEYLGKVVRWYYSKQAPGPIVYASNGNTVSLSYGAKPCMTLPEVFPTDIDYDWYCDKAEGMLKDVGYYRLT